MTAKTAAAASKTTPIAAAGSKTAPTAASSFGGNKQQLQQIQMQQKTAAADLRRAKNSCRRFKGKNNCSIFKDNTKSYKKLKNNNRSSSCSFKDNKQQL